MTRPELHQTLTAMIVALDPSADATGLRVTDARLDAPLELALGRGPEGLTAYAAPSASRFVTGFQYPIHRMRITAGEIRIAPDEIGETQ